MLMINHPHMNEIPQTVDGIFENLSKIASGFNLMGSTLVIDKCYFDGKWYDADNENSEDYQSICQGIVLGCMTEYPYNTIQYHVKNRWMLDALRMLYYECSNVIPHCYHNLPNIFKIRRSNGNIQDAIANNDIHGVRIRKSKTLGDMYERFYVRVEFMDRFPELTDSIVKEHFKDSYNVRYKDISLDEIIELNPQIKNFTIMMNKLKPEDWMPEGAYEIYQQTNSCFSEWIHNTLVPCFEGYSEISDFTCSYTFE